MGLKAWRVGRARFGSPWGLRDVQHIRSKAKEHAGSSEGKQLADEALAEHGSLAQHFKQVCATIMTEPVSIELTWQCRSRADLKARSF